jgi:hypothetical protein
MDIYAAAFDHVAAATAGQLYGYPNEYLPHACFGSTAQYFNVAVEDLPQWMRARSPRLFGRTWISVRKPRPTQAIDLLDRRAKWRGTQSSVAQPHCPGITVTITPTAKRPLADTKEFGCLTLAQFRSIPPPKNIFKTHLTYSLVNARPVHSCPLLRGRFGPDTSRATKPGHSTS